MTKTTTITDTAIAADACHQLNLTGLAPALDDLYADAKTTTQVKVIFEHALTIEGLIELVTPERLDLDADDPTRPILLAVSDNGPQMTSKGTREF